MNMTKCSFSKVVKMGYAKELELCMILNSFLYEIAYSNSQKHSNTLTND